MKVFCEHSHLEGKTILVKKNIDAEIYDILKIPQLGMARKAATRINEKVRIKLTEKGWVLDPAVHSNFNLTINAMKSKVGLTIQTGNVTRAFYDLLKFQVMYLNSQINVGVLIVPTNEAARALGSNIANFTRVKKELKLFSNIITIPTLILGIDEESGEYTNAIFS